MKSRALKLLLFCVSLLLAVGAMPSTAVAVSTFDYDGGSHGNINYDCALQPAFDYDSHSAPLGSETINPIARTSGSFGETSEFLAAEETEYVATLMGKNGPTYYDNAGATLGGKGGTVWVAPLEDYASLSTRADVVRATGRAPSVLNSYLKGDPMYGVAVPKSGLSLRLPTVTDAGASANWRPGGFTGVESDGVWTSSGVREFITDGGQPMPKGSVFFGINPDGSWTPIRRF